VVFAGYGITAPEYNYDDYAGLDVKDKLVLVLATSLRNSMKRASSPAKPTPSMPQFFSKAVNAKMHERAASS